MVSPTFMKQIVQLSHTTWLNDNKITEISLRVDTTSTRLRIRVVSRNILQERSTSLNRKTVGNIEF